MNRLQIKCLLAFVGAHLLLLVILFVGPAFFAPRPKPDDSQVLDVIPANLIDAAFSSGIRNATPPAPKPIVTPPPQPTPIAPQPVVQPAPTPTPTLTERLEKLFKSEPAPTPKKNQPQKIDLQPVTRTIPKNSPPVKSQNDSQQKLRLAARNAARNLKNNFTPGTEINLSGNSSVAYANYGAVVVSVYHNAWTPPDGMASDNVTVKFTVNIASDGTVINARIVTPSGDASVDAAVQRMLDRVKFIAPFPEDTKDTERNYPINFNATRESLE
jgi:TonB family protein